MLQMTLRRIKLRGRDMDDLVIAFKDLEIEIMKVKKQLRYIDFEFNRLKHHNYIGKIQMKK